MRRSSRSPASWAATRPRCRDDTTQRLRRGGVLVAAGRRRALAPLQLQHRRRSPLRAWCRPGGTVEHIERITQLISTSAAARPVRWTTRCSNLPERSPVRCASNAPPSDRHAGHAGRSARRCCSGWGWLAASEPGRITVTPPSWRFDLQIEEDLIEEVIRVLGYSSLPDTPPRAPVTRARAQRRLGAACARCATRWPGSTTRRRSTSASSKNAGSTNWPATPTRSACSTRSRAARGDAIQPDRQPGRRAAFQPRPQGDARARLRGRPRVSCAIRRRRRRRRRGRARAADARRRAGLRRGRRAAVGGRDAGVDFFDVKGDVEALLAPRRARFVAAEHPALHPGRCARIEVDGQPSASSASCIRAGARPTSCRGAGARSSSTAQR